MTDEEDLIDVCPVCESSSLSTNCVGGRGNTRDHGDRWRCADCYETFDEADQRERRQDPGIRPDSVAAALDEMKPDDLVTDGGRRRPQAALASSFAAKHAGGEELEAWARDLPVIWNLDDYREIDRNTNVVWAAPEYEPLPPVGSTTRAERSGLCFDVESTEMRDACTDSIQAHLGADSVLHEVRHQKAGNHTDLVYADHDPEGIAARATVADGTEPLHEPLQRFKVWWYCYEHGPKPRRKVVENGKYADKSTNRKHLDWLIQHGYVGTTATGAVDAVLPPSICELHAVELKLRDWETALEQAARARRCNVDEEFYQYMRPEFFDRWGYADYAWVALDAGAIDNALDNLDRFREAGVGLLGIAEGGTVVEHLPAEHDPRRRYTRDRAYAESQVWEELDDAEVREHADGDPDAGQAVGPQRTLPM